MPEFDITWQLTGVLRTQADTEAEARALIHQVPLVQDSEIVGVEAVMVDELTPIRDQY